MSLIKPERSSNKIIKNLIYYFCDIKLGGFVEPFFGRAKELAFLNEKFDKIKTGEFIVLYGRRRLGKTKLAEHFMKNKRSLYFYFDVTQESNLKSSIETQILQQTGKPQSVKNWPPFFEFLNEYAEQKCVVVLDEFQRTYKTTPFISQLQHYWDSQLKQKPILLILVGSSVGVIRRIALSGGGPLFGRKTGQIQLEPLTFGECRQVFPDFDEKQKIEWRAVFGGTPYYLELASKHKDLFKAIEKEVLLKNAPLRQEPVNLLAFEFREVARYNAILSAIAAGKQTSKEISDVTKIRHEALPSYLSALDNLLGLVKKRDPVLGQQRFAHYVLREPFFRFWYRFIQINNAALELENTATVLDKVREELNAFTGPVFEDVVRELLTAYNRSKIGNLNLNLSELGAWWDRNGNEIDIAGVNHDGKELLLGEVKWTNHPMTKDVLERLMEKTDLVDFKGGQVHYLLASKNGFTQDCQELAKKTNTLLLSLDEIRNLFENASAKT